MLDEALKHAKLKSIGQKQTQRVLEKGQAKCVYIAQDAEAHVVRPILALCQSNQVQVIPVPTMSELGKACGIEVGAAVAAIVKG